MIKDKRLLKKFSEDYLNLLKENLWIQSYRPTEQPWDLEIDSIWIPDLQYLWRLAEVNSQEPIMLVKDFNREIYFAQTSGIQMKGKCPEAAMLKLFIYLDSPELYKYEKLVTKK